MHHSTFITKIKWQQCPNNNIFFHNTPSIAKQTAKFISSNLVLLVHLKQLWATSQGNFLLEAHCICKSNIRWKTIVVGQEDAGPLPPIDQLCTAAVRAAKEHGFAELLLVFVCHRDVVCASVVCNTLKVLYSGGFGPTFNLHFCTYA